MSTIKDYRSISYRADSRWSVIATAELAANRFVTIAGAYPTAGSDALGVSEYAIELSDAGPVISSGSAIVEIDASQTINRGDEIATAANGLAVKATAEDIVLGIANQAVTTGAGDNAFIEILLCKYEKNPAA